MSMCVCVGGSVKIDKECEEEMRVDDTIMPMAVCICVLFFPPECKKNTCHLNPQYSFYPACFKKI